MFKKFFLGVAIIFLALISVQLVINQNIMFTSAANLPAKFKIYVGPTNIPADNSTYNCIAVQLQDSRGQPARAQSEMTISLSSSSTEIGTVDSTTTVPKGETYVECAFHSTFSPGSTTITATAQGYTTVQATVTTIGPIPSTLAVYGFPSTLPADGIQHPGTVVVQLQDSSGKPAIAPNEGLKVELSSSDTIIGTVDPTIIIPGGQTSATATLTTTMKPGTLSITAVAPGYTPKQGTFKTQTYTRDYPTALQLFVAPPKVPADWVTYKQIVVMLQDSGTIAKANTDVQVTLASSDPDIGTVDQTITIPAGQSFVTTYFDATYKAGSTTITATATDYKTTQTQITTVGNTPSKLALYTIPSTLPADGNSYSAIQIQLQDSSGKPAKDPNGDITFNLFSSTPEAGTIPSQQFTIPFGQSTAQGNFTTTRAAGSTTLTAQASNYATGQAKLTTYLIDIYPLEITITPANSTVYQGNQTTVTAQVTYEGQDPAAGAKITFISDKGGDFTDTKYEGNGTYTTIFTSPKVTKPTNCTITANATKTGYNNSIAQTTIIIGTSVGFDEAKLGKLQLHVTQDGNNQPVAEAFVFSTLQPTGAQLITGTTNSSGYVVFNDIPAGLYTIQVTKEGYDQKSQSVNVPAGKTASSTVAIAQKTDLTLTIIAIAAIIAAVAVVTGVILYRRRQRKKRFTPPSTLTFDYSQV